MSAKQLFFEETTKHLEKTPIDKLLQGHERNKLETAILSWNQLNPLLKEVNIMVTS
jgi:hypothetical protein